MKDNIKKYIEDAFAGADYSQKNLDLKEEIVSNLNDKYDDFLKSGISEQDAYRKTINSVGDIGSLFDRTANNRMDMGVNSMGPQSSGRQGFGGQNPNNRNFGGQNSGNWNTGGGNFYQGNHRNGTPPPPPPPPEIEKVPLYSETDIKTKKVLYPILQAIAVMMYICCFAPATILDNALGAAIMFASIGLATAIFIFTSYTKPVLVDASFTEKQKSEIKGKKLGSGILVGIGVAFYICCVIPPILFGSAFGMIGLIAVATAMMILNGSLFNINDVKLEEQKFSAKQPEGNKALRIIRGIISGFFWLAVVMLYLLISFRTGNWWITWLIFPMAGFASGVISCIFNLVTGKKMAGSIVGICIFSMLLSISIPIYTSMIDFEAGNFSFDFRNELYNDESYKKGGEENMTEQITAVDIEWAAGSVTVKYWDKDYVSLTETSTSEIDEDYSMRWKVENGKLIVKSSKYKYNFGFFLPRNRFNKNLTLLLPEGQSLDTLKISVASADLVFDGVDVSTFDISTASGDIDIKNFSADTIKVSSASGDVTVSSVTADSLKIGGASSKIIVEGSEVSDIAVDIASGDVNLNGKFKGVDVDGASSKIEITSSICPDNMDINTASGTITVNLPSDTAGFTANVTTASGKITMPNSSSLSGKHKYTYKDGSASFDFDTASGSIKVFVAE